MIFPHYHQLDTMDCGPTCLKIIAQYYGKTFSIQDLREWCVNKVEVDALGQKVGCYNKVVAFRFYDCGIVANALHSCGVFNAERLCEPLNQPELAQIGQRGGCFLVCHFYRSILPQR